MSAKVSAFIILLWPGGSRARAIAASARRRQAAGEKLAAVAQPVLIDAVADAVGYVPFDRDAERGEPAGGMEQRLRRDEIVAVAVHEQYRRARLDLGRELFRIGIGWERQQSGIADDRERRRRAAQPHMQRHHGALAEADERERRGRQIAALELGVEEACEDGRRLVDAGPAFIGVAEGEREPLPANRRLAAGLRGVRGDEGRLRQEPLPRPADVDEVVAVGAVAVQEHDELARRTRARLEPRTVEFSHCPPPPGSARRRAAWLRDSRTRACRRPRRAMAAMTRRAAPSLSRSGAP